METMNKNMDDIHKLLDLVSREANISFDLNYDTDMPDSKWHALILDETGQQFSSFGESPAEATYNTWMMYKEINP